jgi:hypothetical protein
MVLEEQQIMGTLVLFTSGVQLSEYSTSNRVGKYFCGWRGRTFVIRPKQTGRASESYQTSMNTESNASKI